MSDIDLLKLAAKAAGIVPLCFDSSNNALKLGNNRPDFCKRSWNPLTDDGDALRLAVKLNLIVGAYGTYSSVGETYEKPKLYTDGDEFVCWHHETHNDTCAATRRAIVRAAAEIGKAMP